MLLGSGGSFQGTFEALQKEKRLVNVSLVTGETVIGRVAGHPTTAYVVIRETDDDPTEDSDVLIPYSSVVTIRIVPRG
jgi:hypothetical protein